MTNISTSPARARTDVREHTAAGVPAISDQGIRKHGLVLAAGAAVWSAAIYVWGATPGSDPGIMMQDVTGFLFQVGVLALLQVQLKTRGAGISQRVRRALKVERVVLGVAMVWSLLHGLVPSIRDDAWLAVLDIFWPLSMLGMFVIGIKVVVAGRWCGAARLWSFVAETWAIVTVPCFALFGSDVADVVGATHLLLGYTTLGLILATRPDLVRDRG
jgi:hypothetical protein